MKKLVLLSLVLIFALASTQQAMAFVVHTPAKAKVEAATQEAGLNADAFANLTVEEFLALTPRDIRKQTGERLSLKETIALKAAQKKIKKELRKVDESAPKSQLIALLLVILVGGLGIHRFYLGYTTIGIIQLLTLGGCGVWALIDLIRIITGDLGPADGSAYDPKL